MTVVVECENISKRFKLKQERYGLFRETLLKVFRSLASRPEEFWALKDINFSVNEGEILGLVGRNGSGKSTLLKLLASIILPTTGKITLRGRMEALIEVGAGLHPELTGRENIYLNGSIQGINRQRMKAYLDEIIEFSELGQFIDIPVKHYSSGMYMRLAFSINLSLNPDILLVDEVLAVGDAAFQQKCITWLKKLRDNNKTIIFVSHSADAIRTLCTKAILIENGQIHASGTPKEVLDLYHVSLHLPKQSQLEEFAVNGSKKRYGVGRVRVETVEVLNGNGYAADSFTVGEEMTVRLTFLCLEQVSDLIVSLTIRTELGIEVYATNNERQRIDLGKFNEGDLVEVCFRHTVTLGQNSYLLNVGVAQKSNSNDSVVKLDYIYDVTQFSVFNGGRSFGLCDLQSTIHSQLVNSTVSKSINSVQ